MKRWLFRCLVAALTFCGGYALVWQLGPGRPLSLCEIDAAPEHYREREVRVRVWLERIKGSYIIKDYPEGFVTAFSLCKTENLEGASVEFADVADAEAIPSRRSARGEDNPGSLTEAVISGYLAKDDHIPHCFTPKYTLQRAKLEKVLATVTFANNDEAAAWIQTARQKYGWR